MKNPNDPAFSTQGYYPETLNFQKVGNAFLSRWHWIFLALILSGTGCYLFLKLARPVYAASATIKFPNRHSQLDEVASLSGTADLLPHPADYLSERYSIKSEEVIHKALLLLNDPFSFYQTKNFRKIDLYPHYPLQLQVLSYSPEIYERGTFTLHSAHSISYETEGYKHQLSCKPGDTIAIKGLAFQLLAISGSPGSYPYDFVFNDPSDRARAFFKKIKVEEVEEGLPLLQLSFRHHNARFSENFLTCLIEAYREYNLAGKRESSSLSIRFIQQQASIYHSALQQSAKELELFKIQNQLPDLTTHTSQITEKISSLHQRKNELQIQKAYIDLVEQTIESTFDTINYLSAGLDQSTDHVLVRLLEQFNDLISRRKELLTKYLPGDPVVKNLDEELLRSRNQIRSNIRFQKQKNQEAIDFNNYNLESQNKKLDQIPALEKSFVYLQSNFEVNKNIYYSLINKEIESSILSAGIVPSFTVISPPDKEKVFPEPVPVIILFTFVGLIAGFGSVLSRRVLTSTFTTTHLPDPHPLVNFLGIIHHFPHQLTTFRNDFLAITIDRSAFGESVRTLRTRLSFCKNSSSISRGIQLLITSEKSGEGKSFVALNLALSLSRIDKKVILIAVDLRKSNLHSYFNESNEHGLSTYLHSPFEDLDQLIKQSGVQGLDYIPAGPAPSNPTELLQKPLLSNLLEQLKGIYDYILLDTAPVGLVADNIPLLFGSDHVLFIIRWLVSDKNAHLFAGQLADDYQLPEISVVLNDYLPDPLYDKLTDSSARREYLPYRYENAYYSTRNYSWLDQLKKLFRQN